MDFTHRGQKRGNRFYRVASRRAPSQWETVLLCNDDSHWLGAKPKISHVSMSCHHHINWPCSFRGDELGPKKAKRRRMTNRATPMVFWRYTCLSHSSVSVSIHWCDYIGNVTACYWYFDSGTLSFLSNNSNSFEDRMPLNEITNTRCLKCCSQANICMGEQGHHGFR